ncbi:MAG: ATP-binding protein [Bacteroidetes bacterium]|nr:ATP-binding protein [Bacteroidota bacterium]
MLNKEIDLQSLNRLNESACDYYIETLNIISNIDSKSLVTVLTNFLQLKVAKHYLESNIQYDFNLLFDTKFTSLFNTCSYSKDDSVKWIALKSIIDIGSNSFSMWNKLNGIFQSEIKFTTIFKNQNTKIIINSGLKSDLDLKLNPRDFLIACFEYQRSLTKSYNSEINSIIGFEFTPSNFRAINEKWLSLSKYNSLLQKTDKETFQIAENIVQIIQPYLNRNDKERGNILYSVIKKIESQLDFINQNTTFYGRTFFYRLLKKWRSEVDDLFEEKIAQSYPLLLIEIDPPYYIESDNEVLAPLIIRNEGDATAEGYFMKIICESTEYEGEVEIPFETSEELPSKSKKEFSFVIPKELLEDSNAVEVKLEIEAIYQKNRLPAKKYEFTIEKEPASFLTPEDIPWKTGNSTPQQLFFGRDKLISDLFNHYRSINKDKPYILYGLTRTGKSSILEYLRKKLIKQKFLVIVFT